MKSPWTKVNIYHGINTFESCLVRLVSEKRTTPSCAELLRSKFYLMGLAFKEVCTRLQPKIYFIRNNQNKNASSPFIIPSQMPCRLFAIILKCVSMLGMINNEGWANIIYFTELGIIFKVIKSYRNQATEQLFLSTFEV